MDEFDKYTVEAEKKWGQTAAYKEHLEKTKGYSKEKWNNLAGEMNRIMADFAACMKNGENPDSTAARNLVERLQGHITGNYYVCTDEVLAGLGQMYVKDERFKNNIDKNASGTAEFTSKAIENYCSKRK